MNFERSDILKPKLDSLEADDQILFPSLQQKVLGALTARGHGLVSSASIHLIFQAFRDELTKRGDQILSQIREVFTDANVEDMDHLAKGLREELIKRLESAAALASSVFLSSTESIRSRRSLWRKPRTASDLRISDKINRHYRHLPWAEGVRLARGQQLLSSNSSDQRQSRQSNKASFSRLHPAIWKDSVPSLRSQEYSRSLHYR